MSGDVVIRVDGVGKRFKIYPSPWARAAEWLTAGRRQRHADFWALRDVSFEVGRGECFGVIGPNGSGKTTLLRILSRVLEPTTGSYSISPPTVYSLLELGTGFHPDLSGRENVRESARLLRLPASYLDGTVMDSIEEFADIGDYFDRPIRFYSSGMIVRLGFAMFAFLKPDVLIVDEALSVGDIFFQQKCTARMDELRAQGTTFLFVSHDMDAVRRLCRNALVLQQGAPVFLGPAEEAINRYHGLVFRRDPGRSAKYLEERRADPRPGMEAEQVRSGNILRPGGRRHGSRAVEIVAARVTDDGGHDTLTVALRERLHFDVLLVAREEVATPSAGLVLTDRLGNVVFGAGSAHVRHRLPPLTPGDSCLVRLSVRFNLHPGQYTLMLGVSELGHPHDWHEDLGPIEVFCESQPIPFGGIADLPIECRHAQVVRVAESDQAARASS